MRQRFGTIVLFAAVLAVVAFAMSPAPAISAGYHAYAHFQGCSSVVCTAVDVTVTPDPVAQARVFLEVVDDAGFHCSGSAAVGLVVPNLPSGPLPGTSSSFRIAPDLSDALLGDDIVVPCTGAIGGITVFQLTVAWSENGSLAPYVSPPDFVVMSRPAIAQAAISSYGYGTPNFPATAIAYLNFGVA